VSVLRRRNRRGRLLLSAAAGGSQGRRALSLLDANVVFLGRSDVWDDYSQLSVDQSSLGVDLTDATTYAHLSPHEPSSPISNRTIESLFRVSDAPTGVGINVSKRGTGSWAMRFDFDASPPTVQFNRTGSNLIVVALPDISAATDTFLVAISTGPNPETTGAGNALTSVLHVWNITQDTYASGTVNHTVTDETDALFAIGAFDGGGGSPFPGESRHFRLSNVARSRDELEALIPLITAGEAP
jgi:hypothetical protein